MKNVLKLLSSVLVFAVAVFALPSLAATNNSKFFSMTMSATGNVVTAVIMNTSPPNTNGQTTSAIGSVDLSTDLGWTFDFSSIMVNGQPYKTKQSQQPPGHIKVVAPSPVKPGGPGLTIAFKVTSTTGGDATFNALVYTGTSFSGNLFLQSGGQNAAGIPTDSLECNAPASLADGSVVAIRGTSNKDGTSSGDPCAAGAAVTFATLTLGGNPSTGLPPNLLHFRWNKSGGTDGSDNATAAFEYFLYYAGTPPTPTKLGWLRANGDLAVDPGANPNVDSSIFGANNPVVFINAPSCNVLPGQLPTPYGKLTADPGASSSGTQQDITIDTTGYSPPASPGFPIYVGFERMQVIQFVDSTHWTVLRDTLGTGAPAHSVNALLMSTPLPILAQTDVQTAYVMRADGSFQTTTDAGVSNPYLANVLANAQGVMQAQACFAGTGVDGDLQFNSYIDIGDQWVPVR